MILPFLLFKMRNKQPYRFSGGKHSIEDGPEIFIPKQSHERTDRDILHFFKGVLHILIGVYPRQFLVSGFIEVTSPTSLTSTCQTSI